MTMKISLIFKKIRIRKMPGFNEGLGGFENLSSNINIVTGPNASGKSSSARVIQQLLWHNNTSGIQAEATASAGDDNWVFKIDSSYLNIQRNGKEDILYGLPPAETQNRYMLALHELVTENENELARRIVKESIGGFDIGEAASNLGYSDAVRKTTVSEYVSYNKADLHFREVKKEHLQLHEEENRLDTLTRDRDMAKNAARLVQFYQLVINYLEAIDDLKSKNELLRFFPPVLSKANGDEYNKILELEENIEESRFELKRTDDAIADCSNSLSELDLPDGGIDDVILEELEERIKNLERLEHDIVTGEEKKAAAAEKVRSAAEQLGQVPDPGAYKGINLPDVPALEKFLEKANRILVEKQETESRLEELKVSTENQDVHDSVKLNEGIKLLSYWLQEEKTGGSMPLWFVLTLVGIIVVTGITAMFAGWLWIAGVGIGLLVLWLAGRNRKRGISDIREKDFVRTGLKEPGSWKTENVSLRLQELIEELGRAREVERNRDRIAGYQKHLEKILDEQEKINTIRNAWLDKIKALPENYSELYWFLFNTRNWLEQHEELNIREEKIRSLQKNHQAELDRVNRLFGNTITTPVNDAVKARAAFKKLSKDEMNRRNLVRDTKRLAEEKNERSEYLRKNTEVLNSIYNKFGIETGKKDEVKLLLEKLDEYIKTRKAFEEASVLANDRKRTLEQHPQYSDHSGEIESLDIETAREKQAEFTSGAEKLPELERQITSIRTLVDKKKKEHNLEEAIAAREDALEKLTALFENNLSSITGNLIVGQLGKETSEHNKPRVYKRAGELLNRITTGRYELILEEKGEPAFRAFDTTNNTGLSLFELSTGTRIQLLLAVRLAFIETQETTVKLPILADELLANSDDVRATAIIQALSEISREGRQIFYFTAQEDEVYRWKDYLSTSGRADYKIIRLSENSELRDSPDRPKPHIIFNHEVPAPGKKNHLEYGKVIGIKPFDLTSDSPSGIHPWYLIDDTTLLFNVLRKGISSYGQLNSYLQHKGTIDGLSGEKVTEMHSKENILEHFIDLYRVGRPKPIDRHILELSKAVNDTFIDEVTSWLEKLNNDPEKLLQSLENKAVAGFRKSKIEELREYLENEGYIDNRMPYSPEDLNIRMKAFISGMDLAPNQAENFLRTIINFPVNQS